MLLAWFFMMGSIVGSFLNVCIYRIPLEQSIAFPASHCFSCKKNIAWYDNIPILSYLLLGGKCRQCKSPYSMQYPLVEVITGLMFVVFAHVFGWNFLMGCYLFFAVLILVESVIDFHHQIIPDQISLGGAVVMIALSALVPQMHNTDLWWKSLLIAFLSAIFGSALLYFIAAVSSWILKKEAMGMGDVKLMALIGAVIGIKGVLWTLFASSFLGSAFGIISLVLKRGTVIPYGPFLGAAAVAYLFVGKELVSWYLNTIGMMF